MATEHRGSADRPGGARSWFARAPLWARIALGVAALGLIIVIVVASVSLLRPVPTTAESVEDLCRSAAEAGLERRGDTDISMAASMDVTALSDEEYRVQGSATYRDEDDRGHTTNLRCTVRLDDGQWRVASVRFNN